MKPLTAYQLAVSGDDTETVCSRLRESIRAAYIGDRDLTIDHADLKTLLYLVDTVSDAEPDDIALRDHKTRITQLQGVIKSLHIQLETLEIIAAELT